MLTLLISLGEKLNDTNDSKSILEEYISLYKDITILVNKLFSYTSLTMSVDTKNEIALKNLNMIENKYSEIAAPLAKINKFIGSIENLKEIIEESPLLKEHEYHLNEIAKRSKYFLSEKEEAIIAKMRNSGSSAWNKMMELLVSNLKVDIEENGQIKELPLSVVRI